LIIWVVLAEGSSPRRFLLLVAQAWDKVLRPRQLCRTARG
jgi:hypothetical protein